MTQNKMYGRLGWHGQCSCCNGPRGKRAERAIEEREWRRQEAAEREVSRPAGASAETPVPAWY